MYFLKGALSDDRYIAELVYKFTNLFNFIKCSTTRTKFNYNNIKKLIIFLHKYLFKKGLIALYRPIYHQGLYLKKNHTITYLYQILKIYMRNSILN